MEDLDALLTVVREAIDKTERFTSEANKLGRDDVCSHWLYSECL